MRPCDVYSGTKAEAEEIVRSSSLDWVVLRFGGVLSTDLSALPLSARRDVLRERTAERQSGAYRRRPRRRIGMRGGDDGRRRRRNPLDRRRRVTPKCYGDLAPALVSALGMPGAMPPGRPGNPDSDNDWFVTDWMDTTRAQEALKFQHYSWPDMLAELQASSGGRATRGGCSRRSLASVHEAPGRLLESAGPVRRSVGRDPRQVGRARSGIGRRTAPERIVFAPWRISKGAQQSSPAGPTASVSPRHENSPAEAPG